MSAQDLLGRIANARAQLMRRGYVALELEIGDVSMDELGSDVRTVLDWPEVRSIKRWGNVEGFLLRGYGPQ